MKSICLFSILSLFTITTLFSQSGSSFGVKGGINYNGNGDYFRSITNTVENPDRNIGYHIGVYGKLGSKLYFRPELMYTSTKSDYTAGTFELRKLDAPLLAGLKVIGPLHVFTGPALQYILDTDLDDATVSDVENNFSIGVHFGIGVNLKKLGLDLRYERGFSENETNIILNNSGLNPDRLDTRPDQLILSASYKLY